MCGEWHYEPEIEVDEHGNFIRFTGISICGGPHPTDPRCPNRGTFGHGPVETLLPYALIQVRRQQLVRTLEAILVQKSSAFEQESVTEKDCETAVRFGWATATENARYRWEHRNERK